MDHLDLQVRFDTEGEAGEFSGHAVVWGEKNRHNEIVRRGAFRASLDAHRTAGTKPVMLWSHDPSAIIGVWTEVREDDVGLAVRGKLITGIESGREAYERLKAGAVNGLSIGFRALPGGESRQAGVRILTGIDVVEISIVGIPSAGRARITSVRNFGRSTESAVAFVAACRKARSALALKGN